MGPGLGATEDDERHAVELGRLIANQGWVLLTGGRNEGVMEAVNKGAKSAGGTTIGILPGQDNSHTSQFVDFAILTGMGSARNNINVLTSDVVVACGIGPGTASEVSLALKSGKPVILLTESDHAANFFKEVGETLVHNAENPADAINLCCSLLGAARKNYLAR